MTYIIYSGSYSGELAQFSKIVEGDSFLNHKTVISLEESTKAEDKSSKCDILSDLKNGTESLYSEKALSVSFDNYADLSDKNKDELHEDFYSPKNYQSSKFNLEEVKEFKIDISHEDDDSIEANYEYPNGTQSNQSRWRKTDDKNLFICLKESLDKFNMNLNEFWCYSIKNYRPPILMNLIEKVGWRGSVTSFIQRIIKLYNSSRKLSCREMKKLRMTYYSQIRNNEVDWNQILYNFPGKDIDYLKETCSNFKRTENLLKKVNGPVSRT